MWGKIPASPTSQYRQEVPRSRSLSAGRRRELHPRDDSGAERDPPARNEAGSNSVTTTPRASLAGSPQASANRGSVVRRLDEVAGSSQYELTVVPVAHAVPRSRAHEKEPAMEHCAIDLGGKKSQVCIRASDGSIVHESREDTLELGEFLQRRPKSRVVVETCAEAFAIADLARNAGHQVRVVSATLVRTLGVGA